jgi:hypothetical protein
MVQGARRGGCGFGALLVRESFGSGSSLDESALSKLLRGLLALGWNCRFGKKTVPRLMAAREPSKVTEVPERADRGQHE